MVIHNRLTTPDWSADEDDDAAARCLKFPPKTRYEESDVKVRDPAFYDAQSFLPICNGDYNPSPCPVRASCLKMALVNNDQWGVWGGMTGPQRKWIRRQVAKEKWADDKYLREITPPPEYFKDYGDDEEEDE